MRAVTLLCVFPVKFLRLSRDASHVRRGWLLFFASLRGKSVLSRRHLHSPLPRNGFILYHEIRSAAKNAAHTDSPPQTYPGSLCRTLLVSILIYGGIRKI